MKKTALIFLIVFNVSCNTLFMASYGIKSGEILSEEQVSSSFQKNNLNEYSCYILNDKIVSHLNQLVKEDSNNFIYTNFLLQPLQIIIFDNNKMVSQISNCNLGGFPNLDWVQHLGGFPIKHNNSEGYPEISYNDYKSFLTPLDKSKQSNGVSRYKMLVVYSDFMGRQSKKLLKRSKKYFNDFNTRNDIQLIFVNANNSSIANF